MSRTHPGLQRKVNEDAVLVRTDQGLWAVADGMGGHEAGEIASGRVVEALSRVAHRMSIDRFMADAISAVMNANRQLIDLARSEYGGRTIGTTIVGLILSGGEFGCFWAGDSRAYRVREGEIAQLSRDHSLVQELIDGGMLDPAEAENHPNANVVTRAVGAAEELRVDVRSGDARPGDVFLLASDGLTRVLDENTISTELTSAAPAEAADRLIQAVLSRGAPDNVSLIIVRVT